MKLKDPAHWLLAAEANLPPDLGYDTAAWPDAPDKDMTAVLYGASVIVFAERWADLMEAALAAGAGLADCAQQAAREADESLGRWGLTGFQYGCAVSLLARAWEHGQDLRTWHNLREQADTGGEQANREGGVLNTALLSVTAPGGGDD